MPPSLSDSLFCQSLSISSWLSFLSMPLSVNRSLSLSFSLYCLGLYLFLSIGLYLFMSLFSSNASISLFFSVSPPIFHWCLDQSISWADTKSTWVMYGEVRNSLVSGLTSTESTHGVHDVFTVYLTTLIKTFWWQSHARVSGVPWVPSCHYIHLLCTSYQLLNLL